MNQQNNSRELDRFSKVKEAREALKQRALEVLEQYMAIIAQATAAQDYESAYKAAQWLLEHMPREDGLAIIDHSAAKVPESSKGPIRPTIQIGIALSPAKQLPPSNVQVIDVTDDDAD